MGVRTKSIERAAAEEHRNWMRHNPPSEHNKHQHVPYEKLSEPDKQLDRDKILRVHELLGGNR